MDVVEEHDDSVKPRALETSPTTANPTSTTGRCIRLFAWNINGIQPFLPSSDSSITSFFKPVSPKKRSERIEQGTEDAEIGHSRLSWNPLRAFLQRHGWPEVVFLQELKINPFDQKTPNSLLRTMNTPLGKEDAPTAASRYTLDVNLPRDRHNARGFGGRLYGVGTLIREDFASQYVANVRHADWDLEGRVTIVELRPTSTHIVMDNTQPTEHPKHTKLDSHRPLALLNIYAVNGTTAPYRSPGTGQVVGTRHDHKVAFHTRLRDECLNLEGRGFDVVMAGDMNIARGRLDGHPNLRTYPRQHCTNRADFNAKFFGLEDNTRAEAYTEDASFKKLEVKFDGVDVFRALRGMERRYTYHSRDGDNWGSNCDRVDFIIVSRVVFDSGQVIGTDVLDSPQERGSSDHVPLWVKIRLRSLASGEDDSPRCGGTTW